MYSVCIALENGAVRRGGLEGGVFNGFVLKFVDICPILWVMCKF